LIFWRFRQNLGRPQPLITPTGRLIHRSGSVGRTSEFFVFSGGYLWLPLPEMGREDSGAARRHGESIFSTVNPRFGEPWTEKNPREPTDAGHTGRL